MGAPKGNQYAKGAAGRTTQTTSPKDVKVLAQALIKWSEKPDSSHLNQFSTKYRKSDSWVYKLAENHPEIKEAIELAKNNIAGRMFGNGLNNTWNANFVMRYLGVYDKRIKKYEEEKEEKKRAHSESEIKDLVIKIVDYSRKEK